MSIQLNGNNESLYSADVSIGSTQLNADGTADFGGNVSIDSSGRLLVGTSSARSNLSNHWGATFTPPVQIETGGDTNNSGLALINNSSTTYSPTLSFACSTSNSVGGRTIVGNGQSLGWINWSGSDGTNFLAAAGISAFTDAAPGANDMPGRLVFSTTADGASTPTERMRLSANGNLNVPAVYSFTGPVSANVGVDSNGLLFRATSSIRYKKDVETLADSYADAILSCRPVWYRSKEAPSTLPSDWGYWGFIAEEVAEIDPRLVQWKTTEIVQSDDGSLESVACEPTPDGVQYDRFVPHLLNLIKRQGEAIAELQAKVQTLEGGAS